MSHKWNIRKLRSDAAEDGFEDKAGMKPTPHDDMHYSAVKFWWPNVIYTIFSAKMSIFVKVFVAKKTKIVVKNFLYIILAKKELLKNMSEF